MEKFVDLDQLRKQAVEWALKRRRRAVELIDPATAEDPAENTFAANVELLQAQGVEKFFEGLEVDHVLPDRDHLAAGQEVLEAAAGSISTLATIHPEDWTRLLLAVAEQGLFFLRPVIKAAEPDRPSDPGRSEPIECHSRSREGLRCLRAPGHGGLHRNGNLSWNSP